MGQVLVLELKSPALSPTISKVRVLQITGVYAERLAEGVEDTWDTENKELIDTGPIRQNRRERGKKGNREDNFMYDDDKIR